MSLPHHSIALFPHYSTIESPHHSATQTPTHRSLAMRPIGTIGKFDQLRGIKRFLLFRLEKRGMIKFSKEKQLAVTFGKV